MARILQFGESDFPISSRLMKDLKNCLQRIEVEKWQYLLKEGEKCINVYFVEKGLLRRFYENECGNFSTDFFKENQICLGYESFFRQEASNCHIQALEDSVIYSLSYVDYRRLSQYYLEFSTICIVILERLVLEKQRLLKALVNKRAENRYKWLLQNASELILRVPAKYLASYIGITEPMLSQTKRRIMKAGSKK